jgi:transcriptional regulator with GAF, ATPase, and Fis domain
MPADEEDWAETIYTLAARVGHHASADELLMSLVDATTKQLRLWRAGLCSINDTHVTLEAVWAPSDTLLAAGMQIAIASSPDITTVVDSVRAGSLQCFEIDDLELGLFETVLRSEGIRTWLLIPLRSGKDVIGFLALGSGETRAFDEVDDSMFKAVGVLVQEDFAKMPRPAAG